VLREKLLEVEKLFKPLAIRYKVAKSSTNMAVVRSLLFSEGIFVVPNA
jgi:hypothetical protein